jgi:hypothetical protein
MATFVVELHQSEDGGSRAWSTSREPASRSRSQDGLSCCACWSQRRTNRRINKSRNLPMRDDAACFTNQPEQGPTGSGSTPRSGGMAGDRWADFARSCAQPASRSQRTCLLRRTRAWATTSAVCGSTLAATPRRPQTASALGRSRLAKIVVLAENAPPLQHAAGQQLLAHDPLTDVAQQQAGAAVMGSVIAPPEAAGCPPNKKPEVPA